MQSEPFDADEAHASLRPLGAAIQHAIEGAVTSHGDRKSGVDERADEAKEDGHG